MTRIFIGIVATLAVALVSYGQSDKVEDWVERPFAEGGKVYLSLASGAYTIRAGALDRLVIQWKVQRPQDLDEIKVTTDLSGPQMNIRTRGPARHAEFTIEVPARTDMYLRMRAGDINVQGIEGHKDIRITAGEVEIDTLPTAYSRVNASVTFGDLDARSFQVSKGGIARSFKWHGNGPYTLRASVFAGELKLVQKWPPLSKD